MNDIFIAESVDSPPPRKTNSCLIAFLIIVVLGGVVVAMGALGYFASLRSQAVESPEALAAMDPEIKFDLIRDAFTNPVNELTQADFVEICRTIDSILDVGDDQHVNECRAFVDKSGFISQTVRSREFPSISYENRRWIRNNFELVTDGPDGYENFKVVSIKKLNDSEVLVYLYLWDDPEYIRESRWWFIRKNGQWKLSDWESVRHGCSEAKEYAILCELQDSEGIQNYYEAMDCISTFLALLDSDEESRAIEALQSMQDMVVHPKLADQKQLSVAFLWTHIWNLEKSSEAFAMVKNPDFSPGGYYGQAFCAFENGKWEEALAWLDSYESRVGTSLNALRIRGICQMRLGNNDAAFVAFRKRLELLPNDEIARTNIATLLADMPISEIADQAADLPGKEKIGLRLIDMALTQDKLPQLHVGRKLMSDSIDIPELDDYTKAIEMALRYDYTGSIAAYQVAEKKCNDDQRKSTYRVRWYSLMCNMSRYEECYDLATDKQSAFDYLLRQYDDDDANFSPEQLLAIIDKHALENPDEPWLEYYQGLGLLDSEEHDLAVKSFVKGYKKHSGDDDPNVANSCEFYLSYLLTKEGKWQAVYDQSVNKQRAFELLAGDLVEAEDVDSLRALRTRHRKDHTEGVAERYYAARTKMLQGKHNQAAVELQTLVTAGKDSEYLIRIKRALAECQVANNTWKLVLADSPDAETIDNIYDALQTTKRLDEYPALVDSIDKGQHPELKYAYAMRLANTFDDDEKVVDIFRTLRPENDESLRRHSNVVRSAIRTGDLELARELADDVFEQDAIPLLLVAARTKDSEAVNKAIKTIKESTYSQEELLKDTLAEPFWRDEAFAEQRKELSPHLPLHVSDLTMYLLFSKKPKLQTAKLKTLLNGFSEDEVAFNKVDNLASKHGAAAIIASFGDTRIAISQQKRLELDAGSSPGAEVKACLDNHKYTLSVALVGDNSRVAAFSKVFQVAQTMMTDECVGVYCPELTKLMTNPKVQMPLVDPNDRRTFALGDDWAWLVEKADPNIKPAWERANEVTQKMHSFDPESGTQSKVRVDISAGPVRSSVWMRVLQIDKTHNPILIHGQLLETPQLIPALTAGEYVSVNYFAVEEWIDE